jgi:hypothetical protein
MAEISEADFKRIQSGSNHGSNHGSRHGYERKVVVRLPPPDGGTRAWGMVACAFTVMMHTASMHYITGLFYVEWLKEWPGESRAIVAGCGSLRCAHQSSKGAGAEAEGLRTVAVCVLGALVCNSALKLELLPLNNFGF